MDERPVRNSAPGLEVQVKSGGLQPLKVAAHGGKCVGMGPAGCVQGMAHVFVGWRGHWASKMKWVSLS